MVDRTDFERGFMIFAFDNNAVDYIELAAFCTKRIHKYLNVPVCLVTDNPEKAKSFGVFDLIRVIHAFPEEQNERNYSQELVAQFNNHNRFWAQILTPFYETIIIDSDYVVCTEQLSVLWGCNREFLIHGNAAFLDGNFINARLSDQTIKSTWATVIYFKNTEYVRKIFRLVEYLAYTWPFVRTRYGIDSHVYRNDYSFAIALHLLSGNVETDDHIIPFSIITAGQDDTLLSMKDDKLEFIFNGEEISMSGTDVHVINKNSLISVYKRNEETS